jgi:hypothetical protein
VNFINPLPPAGSPNRAATIEIITFSPHKDMNWLLPVQDLAIGIAAWQNGVRGALRDGGRR